MKQKAKEEAKRLRNIYWDNQDMKWDTKSKAMMCAVEIIKCLEKLKSKHKLEYTMLISEDILFYQEVLS